MSILDLLQHIVNEPAPTLGGGRRKYPEEAVLFVEKCLEKSPDVRGSPQELLVSHPAQSLDYTLIVLQASEWITGSKVSLEDLKIWAASVTTSD
jgi:mitogen-activated protein kinase kinase